MIWPSLRSSSGDSQGTPNLAHSWLSAVLYVLMLRQLPAFLMTSWTRNMEKESSEGGNARRFAWMQASR